MVVCVVFSVFFLPDTEEAFILDPCVFFVGERPAAGAQESKKHKGSIANLGEVHRVYRSSEQFDGTFLSEDRQEDLFTITRGPADHVKTKISHGRSRPNARGMPKSCLVGSSSLYFIRHMQHTM